MGKPYVIIEGLDGAGKGEAIKTVKKILEEHGYEITLTREPGGTPLAENIRDLFKSNWDEVVSPKTDLMMLYASREQLYINRIMTAIAENKTAILQDRSWLTTFAYQIRGLGAFTDEDFSHIHNFVMHDKPTPDLVLYLDIPPEVGFERIKKARGDNSADRMEGYQLGFYKRARDGYLELHSTGRVPNMAVIDANRALELVQADITKLVKDLLEK
jgi:dTMP kinase